MNRRWKTCVLAAGVFIGLLGLSCVPLSGPGPGGGVRQFGQEALVIDDEGSLSSLRPATDQGRMDALTQYLQENRDTFGAGSVDPNALQFTSAVRQMESERSDGESFTMVALHQTHQGATIIDEVQFAAFRKATGGDLLQRVRGRLRDPSTLPAAAASDAVSVRLARQLANSLARDRGFSADPWSFRETPVISVRFGVSGFLVRHFKATEDGGFSSFTAIVDPATELVWVLEDQTACEASHAWPGG
jgi:hypothetical protein